MSEVVQIQLRRGTTAEWLASNPVLDPGEAALDITAKTIRVGDGYTPWAELQELVVFEYPDTFVFVG